MTTREADARPEVDEFESNTTAYQYRDINTGELLDPGDIILVQDPKTKRQTTFHAPRLTPQEEASAAAAIREMLEANATRYPLLANTMLNDPSKLWLAAEIQLMLSPEEQEASYDYTGELMEGLTTTSDQRVEYEYHTSHEATQQMFWNDVGARYDDFGRSFFTDSLAQLTVDGANRVAANAIAWYDTHGLETDEDKEQLLLNMAQWTAEEQEWELGEQGFLGMIGRLQNEIKEEFVEPLANIGVGLLSGAEEAARRRDLTLGQMFSFQAGIEPPRDAGDFGWWNLASGGVDAISEIVHDPLAWLAGLGAGTSAIKTIPIAAKATRAGRVTSALRALLPKPVSGVPSAVTGGRFARVTYSLGAKTLDDLLKQTVKNGIAQDALDLIKAGNMGRFQRLYPAWAGISDNAQRIIQEAVETPEELIEVLKADALNEVLRTGSKIEELQANAHRSRAAAEAVLGPNIPSEVSRLDGVFFHGTTSKAADQIVGGGGLKNGGFTTDYEAATRWAEDAARRRGGDPVVIVSKIEDAPPFVGRHFETNKILAQYSDEGTLPAIPVEARVNLTATEVTEEAAEGAGKVVVRLPPKFYDDHISRDLPGGTELRRTQKYVEVELDAEGYADLVNDAQYYVDSGMDVFGKEFQGVISSAKATLKKLEGVEIPGGSATPGVRVIDGSTQPRSFSELIADQNIPNDLRLQAARDKLALDTYNATGTRAFIMSEVPRKSKRVFTWDNVINMKGSGRVVTGVRRTAARITPGRIPSEIHLFNTRQGTDDLRRIGEHFGLEQGVLDDLVDQFQNLDEGARQQWVWDTFLRRLGRETGVPAFEHQLIQFYKGAGVNSFSASGVDMLDDGSRVPILTSQLNATMPIPVDELTKVFARARSIGTRSKLARAMGFNGRGLGKTSSRRVQLVKRLRASLGDEAEGLTDDQLYDMAYSLVSPNAGWDGRGVWAGKMLPKAGSWGHSLHQWFTKSMLVFRPFQWMWRVALLEEPIRAHVFNLPSLYTNPLQYMARAREAHYLWNANRWAEANMSWGQDVLAVLTKGSKADILNRVEGYGLTKDIFGDTIPSSARGVRQGVEHFVENALYGRTRVSRLDPIKKVPWAVKNRAHSLQVSEKALKKMGAPMDFNFSEEAEEIAGRLVSGYLGEAVGASDRKLYQWVSGMTEDESFTHGRVWGAKLIEFVEDTYGRKALRRRAAILRGETPDITGHDLINSSKWRLLGPDLRAKYAEEVDDLAVAERYLDEMLGTEIDHLFRPFADSLTPDEYADLLDEFASSRRITGSLGGQDIDWDLRSSNFGGGVRSVGDFTASIRHSDVAVPSNLPSPSLDPRFMAEDDRGYPARIANWVLQTFGEDATQTISRRPAWIHTYKRWMDNYERLNVPVEHAQRLATDHANKMVNHVFFNMDEAPYYVARLNRILPFFGATYEVVGTWAYKMPVAVGGTWQMGAGEFARKFDRLIDGMVNIGLLDREQEEDGTTTLTLNFVPPDSDVASGNEMGRWLQGAGFAAINTLDQAVSTILGLEEGLKLRSQGYRLAAGHPLNPGDYGILSFAQADIGLNPATNIAVTALAGAIPGATGPRQEAVASGESLADVADRFGVDVEDLVRYNREVFVDTVDFGSTNLYNGLLSGDVDPTEVLMPQTAISLPGSSLWDAFADTFMPFGEISSPHEFATNFIPSSLRWVMAGIALQNQPTDEFWKDSDLRGVFGGILPPVNEAQAASQLNEAFMYLEAHDLVNGKGPFTRIQEQQAELEELVAKGLTEEANELRAKIQLDTEAFLDRAQKVAAESLIMRGLTGQMLPTTPGHVRLETEKIREFWDTKEYADRLRMGDGSVRLRNFESIEEIEEYQQQLAAWLEDPTADRARAVFRANNPQLMAYLTPKTFYKEQVPDIQSFEEYQRQIESGEREPSPLHVTMWRARSAAIQADYYNKFISTFGNDPNMAAATALQNRQQYKELTDEKELAYDALEMWDDMHGGVYDTWRTENYQDVETWAQDQINDRLQTVRDNLNVLFELEDNLDIELDLDGIANLNGSIRGAIAEISKAIRDYEDLTETTNTRNPYELAINRYFEEIYIPYAEEIAALYDKLPEVADSERESLIYEQIKFIKNQHAGSVVFFDDDTEAPFPNPLEYSWNGKSKEEQIVKLQQWVTRPVEWMDLDQAQRLILNAPQVAPYLPNSDASFDIYREYTLRKIQLDEMFEANEITRSQRNHAMKEMEKDLKRSLIEQGRGHEVVMMGLTPYEKLEMSGLLPGNLGIFGDHVRYYKQVLEQKEETPGTVVGRHITAPLFDMVEQSFFADPRMRESLQNLGVNLQDQTAMDSFLPWLFFGYTGER